MEVSKPETESKKTFRTFFTIQKRLDNVFINKTPLLAVGPKHFTTNEVVAAGILSRTNMYLMGSRGSGKTLLSETVKKNVFGDAGLYLRGDVNLQLKDLFTKLDLTGKTDEEIYRISETINFNFALIDELNRIPGVLQNQFLNIADGYVEIRGKKTRLGNEGYMLMMATGNPSCEGEGYTGAFDEDLALLDRIPLILNMDETELAGGDVFEISARSIDKNSNTNGEVSNLTSEVIAAHESLNRKLKQDPEAMTIKALLMEVIYKSFRYVRIGGQTVDKAKNPQWRDQIISGMKSTNSCLPFLCSEISVRTLQEAGRLAFALFEMTRNELTILSTAGVQVNSFPPDVALDAFFESYTESLKLALRYDRRFIPGDLPEQFNLNHGEMLHGAFEEIRNSVSTDDLTKAYFTICEVTEALNQQDAQSEASAIAIMDSTDHVFRESRKSLVDIGGIVKSVIASKLLARQEEVRRMLLKGVLSNE